MGFEPRQPGFRAKLSTSSVHPPTDQKRYVQWGQDPLTGIKAEEGLCAPQTCRGRGRERERVHGGLAQDSMTRPFLNGTRQCCLGQPLVPVAMIYVGREETKSDGERGGLVVVSAPKLHSESLWRTPVIAGVAYAAGQKNVAL